MGQTFTPRILAVESGFAPITRGWVGGIAPNLPRRLRAEAGRLRALRTLTGVGTFEARMLRAEAGRLRGLWKLRHKEHLFPVTNSISFRKKTKTS